MPTRPLLIGTRGSPLALWQARHVWALLLEAHGLGEGDVGLSVITTSGDRIKDEAVARLRRQGPVHQGDRRGAAARRRRSRRALDEGPADRSAGRTFASPRSCRAPTCATPSSAPKAPSPCRVAAGRGGRHLVVAARRAGEAPASRSAGDRLPRQCRDAAEEARRGSGRRDAAGAGRPRTARPRRARDLGPLDRGDAAGGGAGRDRRDLSRR